MCTHTDWLHLPVWIISGFPQWAIKPVLFSTLSLTFPSVLPSTVGLITHCSNTYLSVQWQLMCAGFICFSTNNSQALVTLPLFHQPKRGDKSSQCQPGSILLSSSTICGFGCKGTHGEQAWFLYNYGRDRYNGFDIRMSVKLPWQSEELLCWQMFS